MKSYKQFKKDIDNNQNDPDMCPYYLSTLFDVSKIFAVLDVEMILKNFLLLTMGNFGVEKGFIMISNSVPKKTSHFVHFGSYGMNRLDLQNKARNILSKIQPHKAIFQENGPKTLDLLPLSLSCVLPFTIDAHYSGFMGLGSKIVKQPYTDDEKKLLETLINNLVVALKNAMSFKEIKNLNQNLQKKKTQLESTVTKLQVAIQNVDRYSKHLEQVVAALNVAQEVQQSLLPHHPPRETSFDIAGGSLYCDETGGDYYDYIELPRQGSDVYAIAVGDVSGHGISSALLMAGVRAYLRSRARQAGSVTEIINDVNRLVSADTVETNQFMTLFFLMIEAQAGRLTWVRAGHEPALLYCPVSDNFEKLDGEGLPLGVDKNWLYREYTTTVKPGQIMIITTDGVWEAHNKNGEMFGRERFKEVIRRNANLGAEAIRLAIIDAVAEFRGETKQEDDITLVVMKSLSK